jgi:phage terminase Nu1 subunit (DNA packaging protein)
MPEKQKKAAEAVDEDAGDEVDDYDEKAKLVNAIAQPLANKKLTKRLLKCVKKCKHQFCFFLLSFIFTELNSKT